MNKLIEVPFEREHFYAVKRPTERWSTNVDLLVASWAVTLLEDGQPIMCGGILQIWQGLGELWGHFEEGALERHKFEGVRHSRRFVERIAARERLHRVQLRVVQPFLAGHRFARALGFFPETTMKWLGPNKETFIQYVRFFEHD